jgi:hypothetical protein
MQITRKGDSPASASLVPTNPRVLSLAKRFRWKPETVISRIKRALPAPLEQEIYLGIGPDFRMFPESLAKLLRFFLGQERLEIEDLESVTVGNNLVYSRFKNFADFLQECLNLLKIVSKEYSDFSLTIEQAAVIVSTYGNDHPERLIEMVDTNLDELCEILGVGEGHTYRYRMQICVWLMVTKVIPENRESCRPEILTMEDITEVGLSRRRMMRHAVHDLLIDDDAMSGDLDTIRRQPGTELLKELGLLR